MMWLIGFGGRRVEGGWTIVDIRSDDRRDLRVASTVVFVCKGICAGSSTCAAISCRRCVRIKHAHMLRQAAVDRPLVGPLDTFVDPKDECHPQQTTNADAHADDDIAGSRRGRRIIRGGRDGVRGIRLRGERVGSVDLRAELALNAGLIVQRGRGRLEIRVELVKVLRRDIGKPLRKQGRVVAIPRCRLVHLKPVRLNRRCCTSVVLQVFAPTHDQWSGLCR